MREMKSLRAVVFGVATVLAGCSDAGQVVTEPGRGNAAAMDAGAEPELKTLERRNDVQIVRATGDITAAVGVFRDLLGQALNPNVAGEQPGDRREINWDGVPLERRNTDAFPGNFFNVNSPRGVLFTTDGTGFRVSDIGYTDLNPTYNGEFNFFSKASLFVARGSTIIDVQFVVAGSNTPATVTGFGSVFEDVGRAHRTTIEYFDAAGKSLLTIAAPRASDAQGISFAGAKFDSRIVARVRITTGDTPMGETDNVKGAGQKHDVVATDDFIYGEPRAISNN